jgi:hypothetical protein
MKARPRQAARRKRGGWDGMGWGRLAVHQGGLGFQAVSTGADYWRVTPPLIIGAIHQIVVDIKAR